MRSSTISSFQSMLAVLEPPPGGQHEDRRTLHGGHFISPIGSAFFAFFDAFLRFRTLERGAERAK